MRKWILLLISLLLFLGLGMKTSDEELNLWRYQDKRAPVSLRIVGDPALAQNYMGEAKSLLYSVKNTMRLNKQPVGWGERRLGDGTIISVNCTYGLDVVFIDTSLAAVAVGQASCTITFISLPASVPPMRNLVADMNVGTIDPGDVQGVDYFKTYFSVTMKNCPTCQRISMSMTYTYATPPEPLHYHNDGSIPYSNDGITTVPPGGDDPNDHLVYSLSPPAKGEVIDHGTDAMGSYFIWKAYTETPLEGEAYSRTGLGILLVNAVILDGKGNTICTQQQKVRVDCCSKNPDLRKVEIWWEDFGTCQPFIMYANGKDLCKMPTFIPIGGSAGLVAYSTPFYAARPLYAIPSVNGGCLPFDWEVSGPIRLINTEAGLKTVTYFQITSDPGNCQSPVTITLKDRCGTSYQVQGSPCCQDAGPLSISYTSLLMSCGQQQTFIGMGGCGPYTWAVTGGGGTIDQGGNYTAPTTNTNCVDNPTIQVTDCCGSTATIKLAINCYTPAGSALVFAHCDPKDGCYCIGGDCNQGKFSCADWLIIQYDCSGNQISSCETNPGTCSPPGGYTKVDCSLLGPGWSCDPSNCFTSECGCGGASPCTCDTLLDIRSSTMKTGGCCPINPYTGLPY